VDYPTAAEEREIVYRMGAEPPTANPVLRTADLVRLQQTASRVFVHHAVVDYVVRVVMATRYPAQHGLTDVAQWVSYGASPRASLGLIAAGRAIALLRGRDYVLPQDVLDVATDVLSHRLVLSYDAIADGVPAVRAVHRILQTVPLPQVAPRQRAGGPAGMAGPARPMPPARAAGPGQYFPPSSASGSALGRAPGSGAVSSFIAGAPARVVPPPPAAMPAAPVSAPPTAAPAVGASGPVSPPPAASSGLIPPPTAAPAVGSGEQLPPWERSA